jgi:hypothetical protein
VGDKSLEARISFSKESYEGMNESQRYEYYLQLLENGYRICAQHKELPLEHLLRLQQVFRDNGCKNEWIHKKKRFRANGLEVTLKCFFTSFDFKLQMLVQDTGSKKELVSGIVIRTKPDELCFASLFKDVKIDGDELVVTEFQDRPKFKFLIPDILLGKFFFKTTDEGMNYHPYEE